MFIFMHVNWHCNNYHSQRKFLKFLDNKPVVHSHDEIQPEPKFYPM